MVGDAALEEAADLATARGHLYGPACVISAWSTVPSVETRTPYEPVVPLPAKELVIAVLSIKLI